VDCASIQTAKTLWRTRLAMIAAEVIIYLSLPIEINNWPGCTFVTAFFYAYGPCWFPSPIVAGPVTPTPFAPLFWIAYVVLPVGMPLGLGLPSCWGTQKALARGAEVPGWARICAKVAAGIALSIAVVGGVVLNILTMIGSPRSMYELEPAFLTYVPFGIYHAAVTFGSRGRDFHLTAGDLAMPLPVPAASHSGIDLWQAWKVRAMLVLALAIEYAAFPLYDFIWSGPLGGFQEWANPWYSIEVMVPPIIGSGFLLWGAFIPSGTVVVLAVVSMGGPVALGILCLAGARTATQRGEPFRQGKGLYIAAGACAVISAWIQFASNFPGAIGGLVLIPISPVILTIWVALMYVVARRQRAKIEGIPNFTKKIENLEEEVQLKISEDLHLEEGPAKKLGAADASLASEIQSTIADFYAAEGEAALPAPRLPGKEESVKQKNCPYCWALNDASANVCQNCGKALLADFARDVEEL